MYKTWKESLWRFRSGFASNSLENDAFVNTNDIQLSSRNFGCRLKSKLKWINLKERYKCWVILLQCSIYIIEKEETCILLGFMIIHGWILDIHIFLCIYMYFCEEKNKTLDRRFVDCFGIFGYIFASV